MRYSVMVALLPAGAVMAQSAVTLGLIESAQPACLDSSRAALSNHTHIDKIEDACNKHVLKAAERILEVRPGSGLITAEMYALDVPTAASGPTARLAPDPAPSSADIPLSFNDPVYAHVTSSTSRIKLPPDSSRTDLSIIEDSGDPTISCYGSCSLTRVRIQSREGVRCVSGNINLTWVYVAATGIDKDHADGLQCYAPGATGTVTVKNSTFKMAGSTTAGYWSADDWRGSHVLENVLFEGGGYGLRIPADGGSSVSLKNVYFVRGSFLYGPFMFDAVKGRRINIAHWENVRWASWQGDRLVLGDLIPQP